MVVPSSLLYCFEEMQFGEVVLLLGFVLLLCKSQLLELGMHLQELLLLKNIAVEVAAYKMN